MDEAVRELALGWLTKSKHDLASARILGSDSSPVLDTAIYHCQQAAEKALKGFLLYHGEPFGKTHDLVCPAIEPGLKERIREYRKG